MHIILSRIFLSLRSFLQWRILWLFHHKFMIGVAGIVLDEEQRVLILKHRYRPPEMMWGLPSGYANRGETLEDTLAREVYEETGYTIEVTKLLEVRSGFQLRMEAYYLARFVGGEMHLDEGEVLDVGFFALDDLPEGMPRSQLELMKRVAASFESNDVDSVAVPERIRTRNS